MNLDTYHELREERLHTEHFAPEDVLDICTSCGDDFFVGDEVPIMSEYDTAVCFCSEHCKNTYEFENKHDYLN